MRFGLIACVHANFRALEAVLRDAQDQGCDSILCIGDTVGYFDHPSECVQAIRSRCVGVVKGNHDDYAASSCPLDDFNPGAREKVEWTRAQLSLADRAWLSRLPYRLDVDDFTIVHASLADPERWDYIFDRLAAHRHFVHQASMLCFNGHTHVPAAFRLRDGNVTGGGTYSKFTIEKSTKYLVNVGSVGQPRDGIPRAAYVVYDRPTRTVELRRISFSPPDSGGPGVREPRTGGSGPSRPLSAHMEKKPGSD